MEKKQFLRCLEGEAFQEIFQDMGWNASMQPYPHVITLPSSGQVFEFHEVAQLGVRIFVCETDKLPLAAERSALDARLRKVSEATYITIFVERNPLNALHHLWMVPVKTVDKRSLVTVEYTSLDQADFLYAKLSDFSFSIGEVPNVLDVIDAVNRAFVVNSATVTKNFYKEFKKKHASFEKAIQNVTDDYDRDWYASVMLNRLMFCYFIQKKGFLDFDKHYLRNRLKETQELRGKGQFYGSFYREFLRVLFIDGLNAREQTSEFKNKFGRIPYLNGGMFEEHEIEKRYPNLDIPDEIFETLFAFFDEWNWHLDTSITASGKDINPDVLGYIFEQYINDRAQMGAYYTKEDITEYIGRNTILPWLFNEVEKKSSAAFKPNGEVWQLLREKRNNFIFPAMLKGCKLPLPPEIEIGVDTSKPDLRKRRSEWNKPTAETHALPTEIWRETVARRQRCEEIRTKIASGEIAKINDFITFNLDIRKFAETVLSKTDDHLLVRHFYDALKRITILDPTCGSGAFLFAALNILEPLYEICLTRMQEDWLEKFKSELEVLKVKYHGNLKYCIYKDIILNNLYGVDIMREATEIARLRLFLKMLAVVDVNEYEANMGVDPLPDIDFNIRCGNTLVGFVNPEDVKKAILPNDELIYGEIQKAYDEVEAKAADVFDLYERFKTLQQTAEGSTQYYEAKKELKSRLTLLNDELDRAMAKCQYYINSESLSGNAKFEEWKRKTQPFHWYSEFYGIVVANGGFDVIIGNPPYVEYRKIKDYQIKGYKTEQCGNLYAYVVERCLNLLKGKSSLGFIIPISSFSNLKFQELKRLVVEQTTVWISNYSNRPGKLFDGVEQRLTIFVGRKTNEINNKYFNSEYLHWYGNERECLFSKLYYRLHELAFVEMPVYKVGNQIAGEILEKIKRKENKTIASLLSASTSTVFYHNAPTYFIRSMSFKPNSEMGMQESSHYKGMKIDERFVACIASILNSSLFYWFYKVVSNCRDFSDKEIVDFPIGQINPDKFIEINEKLIASYVNNKVIKMRIYPSGAVRYEEYYPSYSKPIIDEIDEILAKHYGFTEEELDFIINYDIKYRMNDKLNAEVS